MAAGPPSLGSPEVRAARRPKWACRFEPPGSASTRTTAFPSCAKYTARLTETRLLPTPPRPPPTAMKRAPLEPMGCLGGPWSWPLELGSGPAWLMAPARRAWRRFVTRESRYYHAVRRMKVTVLGAGYMGSAMACVARRRGHKVRLWGTWLDDPMLDPCERGLPHPAAPAKLTLEGLALLRAPRLAEALDGAELVIMAVNSDGAVPVMTKAAAYLPDVPVLSVSKGLLESPRTGTMDRIDVVVPQHIGRAVRFVHAAGPAKAMEVARGVLTWMHFAGAHAADVEVAARALGGDGLVVSTSEDIAGAERQCSALKNAYATGS